MLWKSLGRDLFFLFFFGFWRMGEEKIGDELGKEGVRYGVGGGEAAMLRTSQLSMAAARRLCVVQRGISRHLRHGERRGGAIEGFR